MPWRSSTNPKRVHILHDSLGVNGLVEARDAVRTAPKKDLSLIVERGLVSPHIRNFVALQKSRDYIMPMNIHG